MLDKCELSSDIDMKRRRTVAGDDHALVSGPISSVTGQIKPDLVKLISAQSLLRDHFHATDNYV